MQEIRERDRLAQAKRRATDPTAQRIRYARWREKKEAKLTKIAGRPRPLACELCCEVSPTRFDHCHRSGWFRGWLCDRCNRVLGSVKDSAELLRKLAEYLERQ